jgi:hypothetical protein
LNLRFAFLAKAGRSLEVNLYAHMACVRVENQLKLLGAERRAGAAVPRPGKDGRARRQGSEWRRRTDVCWVSLSAERLPPDGGLAFEWRGGPDPPAQGA